MARLSSYGSVPDQDVEGAAGQKPAQASRSGARALLVAGLLAAVLLVGAAGFTPSSARPMIRFLRPAAAATPQAKNMTAPTLSPENEGEVLPALIALGLDVDAMTSDLEVEFDFETKSFNGTVNFTNPANVTNATVKVKNDTTAMGNMTMFTAIQTGEFFPDPPEEAEKAPTVTVPEGFGPATIIMFDLDALYPKGEFAEGMVGTVSPYIHWMVSNVSGEVSGECTDCDESTNGTKSKSNVTTEDVLAPYAPPTPPNTADGMSKGHRYVLMLLKGAVMEGTPALEDTPTMFNPDGTVDSATELSRYSFPLASFIETQGLEPFSWTYFLVMPAECPIDPPEDGTPCGAVSEEETPQGIAEFLGSPLAKVNHTDGEEDVEEPEEEEPEDEEEDEAKAVA